MLAREQQEMHWRAMSKAIVSSHMALTPKAKVEPVLLVQPSPAQEAQKSAARGIEASGREAGRKAKAAARSTGLPGLQPALRMLRAAAGRARSFTGQHVGAL